MGHVVTYYTIEQGRFAESKPSFFPKITGGSTVWYFFEKSHNCRANKRRRRREATAQKGS